MRKFIGKNMISNNILNYKTENYYNIFKKIKPKKWEDIFNFGKIENIIELEGSIFMKKCELKKNKTVYTCIPYSYDIFNKIDIIEDIDLLKIQKMKNYIETDFNNIKEAVFYIFLDEIISFLTNFNENNEEYNNQKFSRSSILDINKNSYFIEYMDKEIFTNKIINESILESFQHLKIASLELPYEFSKSKTILNLNEYKKILDLIKFPIKKRNFNLKFKKLGHYRVNGFYCFYTNTIIVDPRKTNTFYHELGHLIYDNNININKKIKAIDSEEYAVKFNDYIHSLL